MDTAGSPAGPQGAQNVRGTPGAQEAQAQAEAQEREKRARVARWGGLLDREPRTRSTRLDRVWMEARAIITAHPEWGSKWLGLALGYDEETAKKRGAYWFGRLAALGDLPEGARIVTRAISGDARRGPVDRDALASGAHRNLAALPPVPLWLVQGLRTCNTPDSVRALLDRHTKEPQLDPAQYGAEYRRPAAAASSPARQGAPARQSGQGAQSAEGAQGEGWAGLAGAGLALLVGIGAGYLMSRRGEGQNAPGSPGQSAPGQGQAPLQGPTIQPGQIPELRNAIENYMRHQPQGPGLPGQGTQGQGPAGIPPAPGSPQGPQGPGSA